MSAINWGILGTSPISETLAAAIHESPSGNLHAVASRDLNRARQFADKFDIPHAYASYDELLASDEVDIVYNGLPNHLHAPWSIKIAKANKHILCEKPFTVNHTQAQEVLEVVRQSKVFCMEAFMYRCHPLTTRLVELVRENAIGDLISIDANFSANIHHEANMTAGGAILSLGCYPVSLCRLLVGAKQHLPFQNPIAVSGVVTIDPKTNTDQQSAVSLKFSDGCVASISTSDRFGIYSHFMVHGTLGSLSVENPWLLQKNTKIILKTYQANTVEEIMVNSELSLYATEVETANQHILNKIHEPSSPAMTWDDTLGNMKTLDKWLASKS